MNGKQIKRALSLLALTLLMLGAVGAHEGETAEGTTVMLGTSGATVTLTMSDGKYSVTASEMVTSIMVGPDGTPQRALAANGNMYALSMDADGNWMATYMAPSPVSVTLGTSGDSVSVQLAEDGSYMMNGAAVMDGDMVAAANGNMYMLSMANGMWSATYVPAEASVTLGITGETVTVTRAEDGTYWLGDMALMDGTTTMASNGNTYALSMDADGNWMATYMAPSPATVDLGTSGASVTFRQNENGTYSPVGTVEVASYSDADGARVVTATNGNSYTLTVDDDGMWMASYNMPAAQSVMLGASGASVDVTKAENGTYWIGTDELMDGDTRVAGDNTYQLSMVDGMWTATYVPTMTTVMLGTSGESAELKRSEDGSYWLGGMAVMDGTTTMASNGNTYALSMDADGNWMATFVAPEPISVALGRSGDTVSITMAEDRTYWISEMEVTDGSSYTSAAGNDYTLMRDDAGMWTAMYNGEKTMVALGTSGSSVTLVKQEDGSYAMDGKAFEAGMTATAENGMVYVLSMDADGMWMADYVTNSQTVALGISGNLTLTQAEDGTWWDGETQVMSGSEHTAENGNKYLLSQDSEGAFTARYQPETMEILGTGLTAATKEDGTGYNVDGASLGITGTGNVTVSSGAMYRVWKDGDTMMGARYDKQRHADSVTSLRINATTDNPPKSTVILRGDDEDTIGNEDLTALTLNGENFAISELLGSGSSERRGDNFAAAALAEVKKLKAQVEAYVVLDNADGDYEATHETAIRALWNANAQAEVNKLFGADDTTDPITPNVRLETAGGNDDKDDVLALFDSLITALSTKAGFTAATADGGDGALEEAGLSAADAATAFDAIDKMSMAMFGSTANTRYGAYWQKEQDYAHGSGDLGKLRYVDAAQDTGDRGQIGSFSYGVIDDVTNTLHLGTKGSLYYEGGTIAVTGGSDPKFYEGDISIQVRLSTDKVNGVVSNLLDSDGLPWMHDFGTVESITLPEATLTANADWNKAFADASQTSADPPATYGHATINYKVGPGSPAPTEVDGGFRGFLLGKSGDALGTAANGTWWIADGDGAADGAGRNNLLTAGFGAEQTDAPPDYRPPESPITVAETTALPTDTADPATCGAWRSPTGNWC